MELTEQQRDALTEVLNIATARTAAALSDLTGQRVLLDVPQISVHPLDALPAALSAFITGDIATVHQIFSGSMAGDALLVIGHDAAVSLVALLTEEHIHLQRLNASAREVLTEIGNILLNACLGVFGDLLQVHVSFAVPRLHLNDLHHMMRSVVVGKEEIQYGLVVQTTFRLHNSAVSGYLVVVLGVASLDRLIEAIERFG